MLLMVLPKNSHDLLPNPLNKLANNDSSLYRFFPDSFEIDFTGKYKEWEGVVIVPIIDAKLFMDEYNKLEKNISNIDKKRNISGKNFIYKYDKWKCGFFRSFYGNIYECPVCVLSF
jgi:5'-3' exonuclease